MRSMAAAEIRICSRHLGWGCRWRENTRFSQYSTSRRRSAPLPAARAEAQILYYVDHRIGDGSVNKENKKLRSSSTESWDGKKEASAVPCARRCVPAHVSWLELLSRLNSLYAGKRRWLSPPPLLKSRSDEAEMEITPIERIAGNNAVYQIPHK